jgi:hypothetical protein
MTPVSTIEGAVGNLPNGGVIWVAPGSYSPAGTITLNQHTIIGLAQGSGALAGVAIGHGFNGNLFNIQGSCGIRNVYLEQNGAYTGAALYCQPSASVHLGFLLFERLVITDPLYGGWQYDVYLDGHNVTDDPGPIGIRSTFFHNCQFFGAYTPGQTVYLNNVVHCFFSNCEIITAPQSEVVVGCYIATSTTEDVFFSGCRFGGTFYTEAAGGLVFSGRIDALESGAIECAAGSQNNIFLGDVRGIPFTNSGTTSGAEANRLGTAPPAEVINASLSSSYGPTGVTPSVDGGDDLLNIPTAIYEGSQEYYVDLAIPLLRSSYAGGSMSFTLYESGAEAAPWVSIDLNAVANTGTCVRILIPFSPTSGSHTYTVQWGPGGAAVGAEFIVIAGSGTGAYSVFARVIRAS